MDFQKRTSRRRSYNIAGHAHELTFSCYHGFQFLSKERTCLWLAEAIDATRNKLDVELWAYVFMPEHVHLIVHPRKPEYEISEILKSLKNPVSRKALAFLRKESPEWLRKVEQQRGTRTEYHFWQPGGGYDRNITEPGTLLKMIDYLHLNPVRRRLVERVSDWRWSSASCFQGENDGPLKLDPIPPEWLVEG
ncbi:MAG: transposase [Planctomycetes bacterium]|nr:transposase [Planctomycetota bacterium]